MGPSPAEFALQGQELKQDGALANSSRIKGSEEGGSANVLSFLLAVTPGKVSTHIKHFVDFEITLAAQVFQTLPINKKALT